MQQVYTIWPNVGGYLQVIQTSPEVRSSKCIKSTKQPCDLYGATVAVEWVTLDMELS